MPFSGSERRTSLIRFGYLALLVAVSVLKGGSGTAGLCAYQAVSLGLLFIALDSEPLRGSSLDAPVLIFMLLMFISTVYSMFVRMKGLIYFSTMIIHCSNFYILGKIGNDEFTEKIYSVLTAICSVFSLGVILRYISLIDITIFVPNANLLSGLLICGIIALICKLESGPIQTEKKWGKEKTLLWLAIALNFTACLLLFSLGAITSLCCGLFTLAYFSRGKKIFFTACAAATVCVFTALLSPVFLQHAYIKITAAGDNTRFIIWRSAASAFMQKPFFGYGLGSFGKVYNIYKLPITRDIAQYEKTTSFAHNEYLQLAVETGLAGLISFLLLIAAGLRCGIASMRQSATALSGRHKRAAFACAISLLTHALVDFNLHLPALAFILVFSVSLLSEKKSEHAALFIRHIAAALKIFLKPVIILWIAVCSAAFVSDNMANLAKIRISKGSPSSGILLYKISTALNPFDTENLDELAKLSDGKTAEKILKRAVKIDPDNDRLYANLARSYFSENRYQESVREYAEALRWNPKNTFYYSEMGDAQIRLGDLDAALASYEKAILIEPFYCFAQYRLGEILLNKGKADDAAKAFRNVLAIKQRHFHPTTDYTARLLDFDAEIAERRLLELSRAN